MAFTKAEILNDIDTLSSEDFAEKYAGVDVSAIMEGGDQLYKQIMAKKMEGAKTSTHTDSTGRTYKVTMSKPTPAEIEVKPRSSKLPPFKGSLKTEAKDSEYKHGEMAMHQLKSIVMNAQNLMGLIPTDQELPDWVESKLTLAQDYVDTIYNYLATSDGDVSEATETKSVNEEISAITETVKYLDKFAPLNEISHEMKKAWVHGTWKKHLKHVDDKPGTVKPEMPAARQKMFRKTMDAVDKETMRRQDEKSKTERQAREPKVHDLRHMDHGEVYDHTQTSGKIKDGDVLHVKGGVAAMLGAWPTMIHGKSDALHHFRDGTTIHNFEDGSYHKTAKAAGKLMGISEDVASTVSYLDKFIVEGPRGDSPTKGTRLISRHEGTDGHHAEVRYDPDWQEYQVHHYHMGKHLGEGPVSYHGEGKEGRHEATEHADRTVRDYHVKNGKLVSMSEGVEYVSEVSKEMLVKKYFPKAADSGVRAQHGVFKAKTVDDRDKAEAIVKKRVKGLKMYKDKTITGKAKVNATEETQSDVLSPFNPNSKRDLTLEAKIAQVMAAKSNIRKEAEESRYKDVD